ncbi:MAG: hypothetical protein AAFR96_03420 [Planctomycetota bacterium]
MPAQPLRYAAALVTCLACLAAGQPAAGQTDAEQIELAATPFELSGLGVRFRLPIGATARTRRIGSETQADIIGPDASYRVTITSRTSSNEDLTAEAAAESILLNLQRSFGVTDGDANRPESVTIATYAQQLRTIESVEFGSGIAQRFFIRQPATRDEGDTVRGVALIDLGRGRMLVWDATAPEANFEPLAASLDAMLTTVGFADPEQRFASRGIALEAGQRVLDTLDRSRLAEIFDEPGEQWFRLYLPTADGDEEIGYRRVTTWTGDREDIGSRSSSTSSDAGMLVRIEARTLGAESPQTGERIVYDSRGTYWVSNDLASEAWELSIAIRDGRRTTTLSEIGARDGDEQLMVTAKTPNGRSESASHRIGSQGYIPQPVALQLPRLLVEADTAGDFAYYGYRSDANAIAFRTDTLRRDETGDGWVLRSRVAPGSPELVKFLDQDGTIIREQLPDGKVWEPISSNELINLWRRKGLPIQ